MTLCQRYWKMRGIIGVSRVAADRVVSLCRRAARSSDRISSGGHFCTKGGKLADVEVWQGRRGWRAGHPIPLPYCARIKSAEHSTFFLACFFFSPPHGFWQPHCSYILKVFPLQAQSVSWCILARGWLFFYVSTRLPAELACRMFINKVELGARADCGP